VAGVGPEVSGLIPIIKAVASIRDAYEFMPEGHGQGQTITLTLTRRFWPF